MMSESPLHIRVLPSHQRSPNLSESPPPPQSHERYPPSNEEPPPQSLHFTLEALVNSEAPPSHQSPSIKESKRLITSEPYLMAPAHGRRWKVEKVWMKEHFHPLLKAEGGHALHLPRSVSCTFMVQQSSPGPRASLV